MQFKKKSSFWQFCGIKMVIFRRSSGEMSTGLSDFVSNRARLSQYGTYPVLFQTSFSTFWLAKLILEKKSRPRFVQFRVNPTQFLTNLDMPDQHSVYYMDNRLSKKLARSALDGTTLEPFKVKLIVHIGSTN